MVSLDPFSHGSAATSRTDIKEWFLMVFIPISSGVPQGSILGPLMFLVYVNDLPSYTNSQSTIALFADDSKLYRPIDLPDSTYYLQNDLDNLHKWSLDWAMKFNESKCQVLRASRKKGEDCSSVQPGRPTVGMCSVL